LMGSAYAQIQIFRGTTIVWSRYVADGTLNFSGDVVLSLSGQYRLTVNAGANLSLDAIATGTLFTEATSAYTISGKITENASTGGGKKK